jgi:hypothetical protein
MMIPCGSRRIWGKSPSGVFAQIGGSHGVARGRRMQELLEFRPVRAAGRQAIPAALVHRARLR